MTSSPLAWPVSVGSSAVANAEEDDKEDDDEEASDRTRRSSSAAWDREEAATAVLRSLDLSMNYLCEIDYRAI